MVITYGKYRALADVLEWRLGDNVSAKKERRRVSCKQLIEKWDEQSIKR
jgi:hypothetical protein